MNPFLGACAASGSLRLNVEAATTIPMSRMEKDCSVRTFDLPFAIVGRDPRCDLRLDHPEIGLRHVYLQFVNGRLLYLDLGGRAGVSHAGKRRKFGWLAREETLRIGPYRLRLLDGDAPGSDSPPSLADIATIGVPDARLRDSLALDLSHRAVRLTRCNVSFGLSLIGSGSDCPIRLVDPSVASYHAGLILTPDGSWVVDLLGDGGVKLNGHEVSYAKVVEGDAIQVGHSHVRVAETIAGHLIAPEPVSAPIVREPARAVSAPDSSDDFPVYRAEDMGKHAIASNGHAPGPPADLGHTDDAFIFGTPRRAHAGAAASDDANSSSHASISPVMNQVALMRQQMANEFHEARASLYETFENLQQEQAAYLNRELDKLRRLGDELTGLRDQLDRQSQVLADRLRQAEHPAPGVREEASSSLRLVALASRDLRADLPEPPTVPRKHPVGPTALTLEAIARERAAPMLREPEDHEASDSTPGLLMRVQDEHVHNQLCDRIVMIREEHPSRWRKLLGMLPTGKSAP